MFLTAFYCVMYNSFVTFLKKFRILVVFCILDMRKNLFGLKCFLGVREWMQCVCVFFWQFLLLSQSVFCCFIFATEHTVMNHIFVKLFIYFQFYVFFIWNTENFVGIECWQMKQSKLTQKKMCQTKWVT